MLFETIKEENPNLPIENLKMKLKVILQKSYNNTERIKKKKRKNFSLTERNWENKLKTNCKSDQGENFNYDFNFFHKKKIFFTKRKFI